MDLVIASGYPYSFGNVNDEFGYAKDGQWSPCTIDFRETAVHSGGATEAATFDDLLTFIGKKAKGSISSLGLVGHSSITTFSLQGKIRGSSVTFAEPGRINTDTIQDKIAKITAVRDRFSGDDATITLYACHAGSGKDLLSAIGDAFGVKARGFKNEIFWCFKPQKGGALRGRTWYDGVGAGVHPDCESSSFSADIRVWQPDQ